MDYKHWLLRRLLIILNGFFIALPAFAFNLNLTCEGDEKISSFNKKNEALYSPPREKKTKTFRFENGQLGLLDAKQSETDIRVFVDRPMYSPKNGEWLETARQRYDLVIDRLSGVVDETNVMIFDDGSKMMTKYVGKCAAASKRF